MKNSILILLSLGFGNLCTAQHLQTTNYFSPSLIKSVSKFEDTVVAGKTISFKIDTSSSDAIYADLKNSKGILLYSGIFKNELIWIETRNNKGELVSQVRYKLKEVVPLFNHVAVMGDEVKDEYTLKGYAKYYIKDGYSRTYKNGREKSSVYYHEGKLLKIRF